MYISHTILKVCYNLSNILGRQKMIIYITLNEMADILLEVQKIKEALEQKQVDYVLLGIYDSRDYTTIVIRVKDDKCFEEIRNSINSVADVLEINDSLRMYYTLKSSYTSKEVNPNVREKLMREGYIVKVCNSHSENGIMHIGVKVKDVNPCNEDEVNRLFLNIKDIEGVETIFLY